MCHQTEQNSIFNVEESRGKWARAAGVQHKNVCVCWGGGLGRVWLARGILSTKCILNVNCPDLGSSLHSDKSLPTGLHRAHASLVASWRTQTVSYVNNTRRSKLRFHLVWEAVWAGAAPLQRINSWLRYLFHSSENLTNNLLHWFSKQADASQSCATVRSQQNLAELSATTCMGINKTKSNLSRRIILTYY